MMMRYYFLAALIMVGVFIYPFSNVNAFRQADNYKSVSVVTVRPGDTVWSIAVLYNDKRTDVRDVVQMICRLNKLSGNDLIYPGQKLIVPVL